MVLSGCDDGDRLAGQDLLVRQEQDGATAVVTIVGPDEFLKHVAVAAADRRSCDLGGFGRFGITLSWGKGEHGSQAGKAPVREDGCAALLTHRYSAPGEYQIEATAFHATEFDGTETDWWGTATVSVGSGNN